jgi:hypothetical protein
MWVVIILIASFLVLFFLRQGQKKDSRPTTSVKDTAPTRSELAGSSGRQDQLKSELHRVKIDTYIAGVPHRLGRSVVLDKVFNVGQSLQTERDPSNVHDRFAVKLLLDANFVGFVPRAHSGYVATHIDQGGIVRVTVTGLDISDIWRGVSIRITT